MERLTKTYDDGSFGVADDLPCGENSYEFKNLLIKRLGECENAEENGLLVRLPCKVGETIWVIGVMGNLQAEPFEVICMTYRIDKHDDNGVCVHAVGNGRISFFLNDEIGKTVFLTKAEAEAKLKEMEGGNAK